MIRASVLERRCNVTSSCCRLASDGCDRRSMRGGQPIVSSSSIKSRSYHHLSNKAAPFSFNGMPRNYQRSFLLHSPEKSNASHRTSVPSMKRTMSARPSYGVSEIVDENAGDDHADEEESMLNLLNSSRISNGSQLSHIPLRRQSDNDGDEDVSLLQLINRDLVEYSRQSSRGVIEAPLLEQLKMDVEECPHSFSEVSHDGEWGAYRPHEQQETGKSLLDFLNAPKSLSSPKGLSKHQKQAELEDEVYSLHDLLNEETKDKSKNAKYRDLYCLQLKLEVESTEEAVRKHLEVWNSARDRSDHETIPAFRRALDSWFAPLTEAIELEQWLYLNHDYKTCTFNHLSVDGGDGQLSSIPDSDDAQDNTPARPRSVKDRSVYGPLLCLLPPRKIAVLLAHTASSRTLADREGKSKVVSLAIQIAEVLEMEVNVSRALRVRASERNRKVKSLNVGERDDSNHSDAGSQQRKTLTNAEMNEIDDQSDDDPIDRWAYSASHLQRFLDEISGGSPAGEQNSLKGIGRVRPGIVRKRCKEILCAEGFIAEETNEKGVQEPPSKYTFAEWDPVKKVKLGAALLRLLLDHTKYSNPSRADSGYTTPEPAFRYVSNKNSDGKTQGCISIHPDLFKIAVEEELSLTAMHIPLSMRNDRVQPMVVPPNEWTDLDNGGYETIKVPFMRTRHCKTQKDSLHRADLSKVMEGLNVLGNIPWKINKIVLDVAWKCWENEVALGDIPSRIDYEVPQLPKSNDYVDYKTLGDFEKRVHLEAYRKYRESLTKHNRLKQKNMDLHSLRCSAMLKLNQANKYKDFDEIFFPYNVDFRGRAYPVPPHLSIVGSDLCRALLMFANPKPLGKNGLYWLKVHLANLAGADKMSFDGRAQFAEMNMDNIRATVNDPFGENDWWRKFDDPFQGLATCHEIVHAIDSGNPETYMCSLPVHMDGSCNGLQHYAALGRDRNGGKAVNLCVADEPQDVYIGVMHEVIRRVAIDANEMIPFDENKSDLTGVEKDLLKKVKSARLVNGLIDRGVVKRTVMTSVYGVTYIGAKNQISEKIEEKLEAKGYDIDEKEPEIHMACGYLASLTMEVMGQQFKGARQTMNWLTECARLIAAQGQPVAFVSPIGVPVVQPYRQRRAFAVVTLLQSIMLTNDSDVLPLHRQRQVSAFPPNYVHSLDSSHMILTAVEMQKRGLHFSAVHDSYWTHPCDIEEMNVVLRESFIDLYNRPLLEELKNNWSIRYPSITFPEIPTPGELDLNDVRSAPYFFQ
ncbi:hypothetical protein ACHAXA_003363 [Cyclostephanos tholiformis]|uniref:DNA-directed RNA polymerase n=1 Tax=Cyclostephanos tholiformis TaxID=382380 RepID=A0ABD3RE78_9STRA